MLNPRNQRQRQEESRAQVRMIQLHETRLQRELANELKRVARAASEAYPNWKELMPEHRQRVAMIIFRNTQSAARAAAQRAQASLKKALSLTIEQKIDTGKSLLSRILSWAKLNAASAASDISATTEKRIRNTIVDGIENNEHPREIAASIWDRVGGIAFSRAYMIARTESHAAHMTGQQMSVEDASKELKLPMTKEWVATEDARTRETHQHADGQIVNLDKKFRVGKAWLRYPGDPKGPPEEIINCRCVPVYHTH